MRRITRSELVVVLEVAGMHVHRERGANAVKSAMKSRRQAAKYAKTRQVSNVLSLGAKAWGVAASSVLE